MKLMSLFLDSRRIHKTVDKLNASGSPVGTFKVTNNIFGVQSKLSKLQVD